LRPHRLLGDPKDGSDHVLDNRSNDILPWRDAGLVWVARQAPDQIAWVAPGNGKISVMLAAR
jgi:predicted transglutaminase-like cysteine proteinase